MASRYRGCYRGDHERAEPSDWRAEFAAYKQKDLHSDTAAMHGRIESARQLASVDMRALTVVIAGADYPNQRGPTRRFGIELCRPGDLLELRPEPRNKYDGNAIAIHEKSAGIQLGYVPAEKCQWFHSAMARGVEIVAVFQAMTEQGAWVRIGFDHVPTLPVIEAAARDRFDEDFPPDPIWDDN